MRNVKTIEREPIKARVKKTYPQFDYINLKENDIVEVITVVTDEDYKIDQSYRTKEGKLVKQFHTIPKGNFHSMIIVHNGVRYPDTSFRDAIGYRWLILLLEKI